MTERQTPEEATNDEEKVDSELKGNTLRVYMRVLRSPDSVGVREVQRALGFSSPTLAAYHLDKLVGLGLLEKRYGEYHLVREVKVGVLRQFARVGTFLLPRYIFYAVMFTTLLLAYVAYLMIVGGFSFSSIVAMIFGILSVTTSWYETLRLWREEEVR